MSWFTYILRCDDDSLYVGHAHDLPSRVDAHRTGRGARHTASHGAARLIHAEEHATKKSAVARELQIKKWSRVKKAGSSQRRHETTPRAQPESGLMRSPRRDPNHRRFLSFPSHFREPLKSNGRGIAPAVLERNAPVGQTPAFCIRWTSRAYRP